MAHRSSAVAALILNKNWFGAFSSSLVKQGQSPTKARGGALVKCSRL